MNAFSISNFDLIEQTLGRTSAVYGGGAGTHFACQSPFTSEGIRMRLRYIAGKRLAVKSFLH